jgi:hypothetical protein
VSSTSTELEAAASSSRGPPRRPSNSRRGGRRVRAGLRQRAVDRDCERGDDHVGERDRTAGVEPHLRPKPSASRDRPMSGRPTDSWPAACLRQSGSGPDESVGERLRAHGSSRWRDARQSQDVTAVRYRVTAACHSGRPANPAHAHFGPLPAAKFLQAELLRLTLVTGSSRVRP